MQVSHGPDNIAYKHYETEKTMKALSIVQPWPELILRERKRIELRSWNTNYRGPFLIHASLRKTRRFSLVGIQRNEIAPTFNGDYPCWFDVKPEEVAYGAIVGQAVLTDVKKYVLRHDFDDDFSEHLCDNYGVLTNQTNLIGLMRHEVYGFVIRRPERFSKPIPYKGRLGFFDVPMEVI